MVHTPPPQAHQQHSLSDSLCPSQVVASEKCSGSLPSPSLLLLTLCVSGALCARADLINVPEYRLWEECPDLPPCASFNWAYADWVCKAAGDCGPGIATRPARCVASATNRAAANASLCDPGQLENVTKPCELEPCVAFYWKGNELADCGPEDPSQPCGRVSWAPLRQPVGCGYCCC